MGSKMYDLPVFWWSQGGANGADFEGLTYVSHPLRDHLKSLRAHALLRAHGRRRRERQDMGAPLTQRVETGGAALR